ncbi:MAG: Major facilitator superfamily MFS1 [Microgenomates group bacterium Gr01-1014_7]|nr:MAG: Major facilitator superfamily MFS1 [Microgenomates group bacterium Gr01-1014_7]
MIYKPTFSSVIANRGFLNLWVNQILVQLSYNSLNFALIIWVFSLTGSNIAVSALLFAIYIPAVILGLFAGVLVDVTDRKKIILSINILLSISYFSLIFFKESYFAILIIAFFVNALGQFYAPAEASAIPLIVKRRELITANSIFSATLYSCFLLGFGLAGPLITHLGIDFVFGFEGIALALGFIFALSFPSIITRPDEEGKKLLVALRKRKFSDIKDIGIIEIVRTMRLIRGKLSVVTSIGILAGVQMVVGILAVLMPGFLENSLRIKATDASYVLVIPLGAGIVTGGLVLGKLAHKFVKRILVGRAIVFGGLLFFLVGISPIISPAINYLHKPKALAFFTQPSLSSVLIVGSFLLGIAMVSILVPSQTVLQENTPEQDRGKVFSVLGVAMAALSLIPVLLAGVLADLFGTAPIFTGLGAVIMLIGLLGLKPSLFFPGKSLPYKTKEFLGLGHWTKSNVS